eukprot:CAMPEP_0115683432 /NCGR_PEP_ID=MMETSP0272-20121206/58385_1 /TAXON_ID=71861 /ORGANISM="Scrippsiella trochoidea, Strain CCMP3099" /LENGTH=134 /DNA_ID=CAMNT_0003122875 /DNA_START=26 /DNA_END=430 /DNA_ORIENTATION=+
MSCTTFFDCADCVAGLQLLLTASVSRRSLSFRACLVAPGRAEGGMLEQKQQKARREHRANLARSVRSKSSRGLASVSAWTPPAFRMDSDCDLDAQKSHVARTSSLANLYEALGAEFHALAAEDDSDCEAEAAAG